MGRWRTRPLAALAAVWALTPALAAAAPPANAGESTSAESLDAEGKRLLEQHRYGEACAKFNESYRLSPGVGVLLRLGLCNERLGKTASAWQSFRDAAVIARASGDAAAENVATRRAVALEPRLSKLTVRLAPDTGPPGQVRVTRDGVTLSHEALGTPAPVDPGLHVIEATAPGSRTFHQTVVSAEGGDETVAVRFAAAQAKPPPAVARPENSWSTQKTLALIAGGLGVAGLSTGVAFQLEVLARSKEIKSLCPTKRDCSDEAIDVRDKGTAAATVAAIAFAAGAAGVVGGLTLWFSAPKGAPARAGTSRVTPVVGAGQVGLRLEGTW